MKQIVLFLSLLSLSLSALTQKAALIQRSWIKISMEDLSGREMEPDTLYTRYSFDKSKLYISFYPGWDDYQQDWSINKDNLSIGFDTYHIDELTDTSLVIKLEGFRKYQFLAEEYLAGQEKYLDSIDVYDGKPLYKANHFITPRYKKGKPLAAVLQKNTGEYNIRTAAHFSMTFIITENGEVENIRVINGITGGFDAELVKQLKSTSKHWTAARYRNQPIQTEMFYEIKYLKSIVR